MASVPIYPNYTKEFIIYCYASEHTLSTILMHENREVMQGPIAFMSNPLKDHNLKYSQIKKHAYTMVRVPQEFHILHFTLPCCGAYTRQSCEKCAHTIGYWM